MKRLTALFLSFLLFFPSVLLADEGMWLPLLLERLNRRDMRAKGLRISAEELYSVNQASLKDAVVQFGSGCTGEVVSSEGLLLTNFHCAHSSIQRVSSVENDYLAHGFSAMRREEELPCPGATVSFLNYMEDVTSQVLSGVTEAMSEEERASRVKATSRALIDARSKEAPGRRHEVLPLYYGNQYFLFAYTVYRDIRLVVAPPAAIGKFGGDTDNWMWPRHTGDFTLFRIYAGPDNQPAEFSPSNVPFRPRRHLTISTAGPKLHDFAMVYGYPGTTQRYLISDAVASIIEEDPRKVSLRERRLQIMERFMRANDTLRLKYSSKQASVANAWKKWTGEASGLIRMGAVETKRGQEEEFLRWVQQDARRRARYEDVLPALKRLYAERSPLIHAQDYFMQGIRGVEVLNFARRLPRMLEKGKHERLQNEAKDFFQNYDLRVDRELLQAMLTTYISELPVELQLPSLRMRFPDTHAVGGFVAEVCKRSMLVSARSFDRWCADGMDSLSLVSDPIMQLVLSMEDEFQTTVREPLARIEAQLIPLYRRYVQGLMEMHPEATYFPDANFTLRLAYGRVEGYQAREAIDYAPFTTLDGVMEKVAIGAHDYVVPDRLRQLHAQKDFGRWAVDGTVPACFVSSIHTTGGNSGSPVLNARGELLGLNFDRVWEGTMSDVLFDPARCRNITVDIRYILFLIDRFAGAGYLLEEMTLR